LSKHVDRRAPSTEKAWKERAAEVRAFIEEYGLRQGETEDARLQIAFLFDTTDPRSIAEQLSSVADETCQAARRAAHYTKLACQGCQFVGTAELTGGPRVERLRNDCYRRFRQLVQEIVEQAGFPVSEEDAFQGLSERLRRERDLFRATTIEDTGAAVLWLCNHFALLSDAEIRDELAFAFVPAPEAVDRFADVNRMVPPLPTEQQRRRAVEEKLARVSKDLDLFPPLTDDTDFWRVTPYLDRGAFENWMTTGRPETADKTFRRALALDSHEYYRRLKTWPERRRRADDKKKG
jgi:hypothetical protein